MNKVYNKAMFEDYYPEKKYLVCWTNKALICMPPFAKTILKKKKKENI